MMLDSGASPNLVKVKYLKTNTTIDKNNVIELHGISNIPIFTLGSVVVNLFNREAVCHVVPNDLAIPHAGLVGFEFFSKHGAKIDYKNKVLEIDHEKYAFKQSNKVENGMMYVPRRSESTFFAKIQQP